MLELNFGHLYMHLEISKSIKLNKFFFLEKKQKKSIVRLKYEVFPPVEQSLYNYITSNDD